MKKLVEYAIVSDFDGTIIVEDSTVELINTFGNDKNDEIELEFISGAIGNREAMLRHFEILSITLDEYQLFLKSNINIDSGYDAFFKELTRANVPLIIVSAGNRPSIETVLGYERLHGVEIYANSLSAEPYIKPVFAMEIPTCEKTFGPCGNCKRECLKAIRKKVKRKIAYIGDGLTDRCAIEETDLVFAKDALAKYCDKENIAYIPFSSFDDISKFFEL
ncbi:MAG: MtnX-like HAD-IB family phosphatase [Oscillospiraceae bacterium]|nr:MtnX-like HAD-IB family phosphatase [Oscillospiraceae bacterium]